MAFFVFVGAYIFTIYKERPVGVLEITGYIALYSSLFMMLRSEMTAELASKLIDAVWRRRDAK